MTCYVHQKSCQRLQKWGDNEYDIYYTYKGIQWFEENQFTMYVGRDFPPDVIVLSNEPWIFWESDRFNDYNNSDIWAGILGQTQDLTPPPKLLWAQHDPYSPAPTRNDAITIKAKIIV